LDEVDVTKATSYVQGRIEIQDLGSQLVLESIGIGHGGRWLDACAGAGGKSLQLARLLGPKGTVEAFDIRRAALEELKQRAARAGAVNLRTTSRATAGDYSGVVVDAPCSGSGTWRRAPHLKWSTTPKIVAARCALQRTLLARYAVCVRPGGWLVYATCSLIQRENEHIVQDFLSTHPGFEALPFTHTFGFQPGPVGLTILPARHDTDGFFVAALRRR
jgi:16S rRNA (cytosine967-C5)-methyltransferase